MEKGLEIHIQSKKIHIRFTRKNNRKLYLMIFCHVGKSVRDIILTLDD